MNEKFKLIFFNHSQRGGIYRSGVIENERHYLKTMFLSFQQEVLWISGRAESYFHEKATNKLISLSYFSYYLSDINVI
jgi:hypothetical protein